MGHEKEPAPARDESGEWPSQEAPNRSGPPFDDASDEIRTEDPDATYQDLPLARRPKRA